MNDWNRPCHYVAVVSGWRNMRNKISVSVSVIMTSSKKFADRHILTDTEREIDRYSRF